MIHSVWVDGTRTEYIEFIMFAEVLLADSYIYIFSWTLVVTYLFILVNDLVWISMSGLNNIGWYI